MLCEKGLMVMMGLNQVYFSTFVSKQRPLEEKRDILSQFVREFNACILYEVVLQFNDL